MEVYAVFTPFVAFAIAFLFGKKIGDKGCQFVTCAGILFAAFCSIIIFSKLMLSHNIDDQSYTTTLATWISSGDFKINWAVRVDQLSAVMMCVITIVSSCVHIYSIGYMSHDPAKGRFMAYLSLFSFAMMMLVTSDNLLQLFFGWEGVGLASYLLIGFWNYKDSANAAAVKAFVVNRVGDFGLALGLMATYVVFGSINFDVIFDNPAQYADLTKHFFGYDLHALTVICLLLFMGAVGKSAQLGLHTWLPDAMEGPTPVSALIHAATMVTAGVFLVARFSPVFEYAPAALMVVTIFGGLTAFVAATIGLTQFDIKRVIAYSTMSQLGYMFFALGVSAYGAAMFHLMTHAFFKALLFLGAGSVIHAMSDEQDMRNMGGIWKKIPFTYTLMWIGSLALAGIPPFAGYYSKDVILDAAWSDHTWFGNLAYWLGIGAAFMTAFYSWRMLLMTFHGQPRASKKVMSHIHESPAVMLGPLMVLATGAVLAGFAFHGGFVGAHNEHDGHGGAHAEQVATFSHENADVQEDKMDENAQTAVTQAIDEGDAVTLPEGEVLWSAKYFWQNAIKVLPENDTVAMAHGAPFWVRILPFIVGVLGILSAYTAYLWIPTIPATIVRIFRPVHALFFRKWYFDELYDALFVRTAKKLGQFFWFVGDQHTIDTLGPNGFAKASRRFGAVVARFESGYVYQYALVMMVAVVGLISWLAFRTLNGL